MDELKDQVFTIREAGNQVWKVCLNGEILPATWNSKGAAEAGLQVERRRSEKRGCELMESNPFAGRKKWKARK